MNLNLETVGMGHPLMIMMLSESSKFIAQVSEMLEKDFSFSTKLEESELSDKSIWVKIFANIARLFAPIL